MIRDAMALLGLFLVIICTDAVLPVTRSEIAHSHLCVRDTATADLDAWRAGYMPRYAFADIERECRYAQLH
jgi:hypothetical protein